MSNSIINDINWETKHNSHIEIIQLALSSMGLKINKDELIKLHTDELNKPIILNTFFTNNEFDESFGITKRCKGEILNKDQLAFLRKEIESQKYTIRDISIKYWISP